MTEQAPSSWATSRIDELGEVRLGRQRSPDRAKGPNLRPYMRAANVTWAGLDVSDVKEMDFSPGEAAVFELRPGDVLVGEASGSKHEVGKSAIWRNEVPGACFQNTLIRIRPSPAVTPEYLQAHLLHDAKRGALAQIVKGVGIHHLSAKGLAGWKVNVPPLNEQRRIVAKLDALMAKSRRAKEALDAIPPLLDKLRQSILAAAFRGDLTADWRAAHPDVEPASQLLQRIRAERRRRWEEAELAKLKAKGKTPTDDRWKAKYQEPEPVDESGLPELPEGWCWASLEALTDPVRLIRYGILMPGPFVPDGVPYVKVLHMKGDVIDTTALPRTSAAISSQFAGALLRAGDLLVSIRGTYGRVAVVPIEADKANITQDSARIAPLAGVHLEFLAGALRSPAAQGFFDSVAKGVAVRGVNIIDLRRTPIPLAPEPEQDVLAAAAKRARAKVASLSTLISETQRSCSTLEAAALAKAFRGELVPQDPNDEPASVLLERIRSESGVQAKTPARRARSKTA